MVVTTLEESYERCRALNKRHGTTYYWSTYLLPRVKRHHVHALYGFCRYADDIVDDLGPVSVEARAEALQSFGDTFFAAVADDGGSAGCDDPVLKAVVHTVRAFGIDVSCFARFLRSMEMDLSVACYETWDDLRVYMDGSAAVIGEMMLPVLEPLGGLAGYERALPHARALGEAFQLTNFLRDVAEDLDRGRVYLPASDVARFGADDALSTRRVTPEWVALMQFEIARARALYADADLGVAMLPPSSARCIAAARRLYSGILDRIEAAGYDVFSARVSVPGWRKVAAVGALARPFRSVRVSGS